MIFTTAELVAVATSDAKSFDESAAARRSTIRDTKQSKRPSTEQPQPQSPIDFHFPTSDKERALHCNLQRYNIINRIGALYYVL